MTYGRLLLQFLVVPIVMVAVLLLRDRYDQKQRRQEPRSGWSPALLVGALIVVAILYTSPWDNHLIATGVWWYRPALVSGVTLGYIPLEELCFFVLETLLDGLWVLWLVPRLAMPAGVAGAGGGASGRTAESVRGSFPAARIRLLMALVGGALWLLALFVLRAGWQPATYLGWELVWGLPPLILQLGLGGELLWRQRRLVLAALVPAILYLSVVDALAIHWGIGPSLPVTRSASVSAGCSRWKSWSSSR